MSQINEADARRNLAPTEERTFRVGPEEAPLKWRLFGMIFALWALASGAAEYFDVDGFSRQAHWSIRWLLSLWPLAVSTCCLCIASAVRKLCLVLGPEAITYHDGRRLKSMPWAAIERVIWNLHPQRANERITIHSATDSLRIDLWPFALFDQYDIVACFRQRCVGVEQVNWDAKRSALYRSGGVFLSRWACVGCAAFCLGGAAFCVYVAVLSGKPLYFVPCAGCLWGAGRYLLRAIRLPKGEPPQVNEWLATRNLAPPG